MPASPVISGEWSPQVSVSSSKGSDSAALSPSLRAWTPGEPRAYEMKFLLTEIEARQIESTLRPRLTLDPYADPSLHGAYRTTTLYSDTVAEDVFRQIGGHRRRKYRLRRYGDSPTIYLERKSRRGERVRKRRSSVPRAELSQLNETAPVASWSGGWFHEQSLRRGLLPAMRVQYLRTAYFGTTADGPIRVTFDRDVRGIPTTSWCVDPFEDGTRVLADQVICEFKFRGVVPALLRAVIESQRLVPRGVSKYRHCVAASRGESFGSSTAGILPIDRAASSGRTGEAADA